MSTVNSVANYNEYLSIESTRTPKQDLGKDDFMSLLLVQLQYQDPLNPMDNQEMMAQMAQFSALEQMLNIANTTNKQLAAGLVGKFVEYTYTDPDTQQSNVSIGQVSHIKIKGDDVLIGIGDIEVELSAISQVVDSSSVEANTSAFELIGKTVQCVVKDPETKEDVVIEGEVSKVVMKNKTPYLVFGNGESIEASMEEVQNIVEQPTLSNKYVEGSYIDEIGNTINISGNVEYIAVKKDGTFLSIDGKLISLDSITKVINK